MATKRFRKREREPPSEEDEVEEVDDPVAFRKKVEECRKRQTLRSFERQYTGLKKRRTDDATGQPGQDGGKDGDWGLQEQNGTMQTFREGKVTNPFKVIEHEDKMHEYIERQLAARRAAAIASTTNNADNPPEAEEDRVPLAALSTRRAPSVLPDVDKQALQAAERIANGTVEPVEDPNRWLTGIQEVQLPVEYRIRNIEDTETARKQAAVPKPKKGVDAENRAPGKYTLHKRFMVTEGRSTIATMADRAQTSAPNVGAMGKAEVAPQRAARVSEEDLCQRYKQKLQEMRARRGAV